VIRGLAAPGLLDSYEKEGRPAAEWIAASSLGNYRAAMRVTEAALSSVSGRGRDDTQASVEKTRRYGNWMGMDLGVSYPEGALVSDETPIPEIEDPVQQYVPTARPGHRAPHVALLRAGEPASPHDFFDTEFTLFTGCKGEAWLEAAREMAARMPNRAFVVGPGCEIQEAEEAGGFCAAYEISESGAVWVRPDGHVGWRSPAGVADPTA
jgi:putative polyketide hydroxylase